MVIRGAPTGGRARARAHIGRIFADGGRGVKTPALLKIAGDDPQKCGGPDPREFWISLHRFVS